MTIFTCQDTFEDMMTCIYEAWASRQGHSNVKLMLEPVGNLELFCDYVHVSADPEKSQKVVRSIQNKISHSAYRMVYGAAMSFREDKLDWIYRFLVQGFARGALVMDLLQEPAVAAVFEINRKVMNEAHYFREFIRFAAVGNQFLVSHIEPKCNVLEFLAPNFADRMPSENWMIIDDSRHIAVVQSADQDYYLTELSDDEYDRLIQLRNRSDGYSDLWEGFFCSISIGPREDYRRQRRMLPIWYRKNMIEFVNSNKQ